MVREQIFTLTVRCRLDEKAFALSFDDLPPELQAEFETHKTNCDGGGALGSWCVDCHFCLLFDEQEDLTC